MYAHRECENQRVFEIMREFIVVFQVYFRVRVPCIRFLRVHLYLATPKQPPKFMSCIFNNGNMFCCNAETQRAMLARLDMSTKVCFKYFVCPDILARYAVLSRGR